MKVLFKMTALQFKMLLRDKALMIGSIGVAVISMLIFGALFGSDSNQPLNIGVADLDKSEVSAQMVTALKSNSALQVTVSDQSTLVDEMKKGLKSAVVVLQPGFGAGLATAQAKAQIYVDETNLIGAARSRGIVMGVFDGVSKQVVGYKELIQVDEQKVTVKQFRQIDYLTPGMLGLTLMFANMPVGVVLIGWRERGTLKRLNATPMKAWQLIGSQIMSQLALGLAQAAVILLIGSTVFNVQVKVESLPLIGLFAVAGTFSVMALGYVVGNFVKKREAASTIVTLISIPMMFLGGSYFPVDPQGPLKLLVDILPLTHLNRALRDIMLNDATLGAVFVNLVVLVAFGVVLLTLSVRTFRWSK